MLRILVLIILSVDDIAHCFTPIRLKEEDTIKNLNSRQQVLSTMLTLKTPDTLKQKGHNHPKSAADTRASPVNSVIFFKGKIAMSKYCKKTISTLVEDLKESSALNITLKMNKNSNKSHAQDITAIQTLKTGKIPVLCAAITLAICLPMFIMYIMYMREHSKELEHQLARASKESKQSLQDGAEGHEKAIKEAYNHHAKTLQEEKEKYAKVLQENSDKHAKVVKGLVKGHDQTLSTKEQCSQQLRNGLEHLRVSSGQQQANKDARIKNLETQLDEANIAANALEQKVNARIKELKDLLAAAQNTTKTVRTTLQDEKQVFNQAMKDQRNVHATVVDGKDKELREQQQRAQEVQNELKRLRAGSEQRVQQVQNEMDALRATFEQKGTNDAAHINKLKGLIITAQNAHQALEHDHQQALQNQEQAHGAAMNIEQNEHATILQMKEHAHLVHIEDEQRKATLEMKLQEAKNTTQTLDQAIESKDKELKIQQQRAQEMLNELERLRAGSEQQQANNDARIKESEDALLAAQNEIILLQQQQQEHKNSIKELKEELAHTKKYVGIYDRNQEMLTSLRACIKNNAWNAHAIAAQNATQALDQSIEGKEHYHGHLTEQLACRQPEQPAPSTPTLTDSSNQELTPPTPEKTPKSTPVPGTCTPTKKLDFSAQSAGETKCSGLDE